MNIEIVPVKIAGDPFFTTNCYIVSATSQSDCVVVIDPGDEPDLVLQRVGNRTIGAIVVTHGHFDHIGGVAKLAEMSDAPFYAHQDDASWIEESYEAIKEGYMKFAKRKNLGTPTADTEAPRVEFSLTDGKVLDICGVSLQVLHTPGHSRGSICLYNAEDAVLFSGDTLFWGTCGRTDFVGGSPEFMHDSLQRLSLLPPETRVYPGHNELTSIGAELNRGLKAY